MVIDKEHDLRRIKIKCSDRTALIFSYSDDNLVFIARIWKLPCRRTDSTSSFIPGHSLMPRPGHDSQNLSPAPSGRTSAPSSSFLSLFFSSCPSFIPGHSLMPRPGHDSQNLSPTPSERSLHRAFVVARGPENKGRPGGRNIWRKPDVNKLND